MSPSRAPRCTGGRRRPKASSPYRPITDRELGLVRMSCDFVCACLSLPLALFVLAKASSVRLNSTNHLTANLKIDSLFPIAVVIALFGGVYGITNGERTVTGM
jgi:hypothetical protein